MATIQENLLAAQIPPNVFVAGPSNGKGAASIRRLSAYDLTRIFPGLVVQFDANDNAYFDITGGGILGNITAVIAGVGLSGWGTSGAVTLNLGIPISVAHGGTGTSSPSLIAGSGISITGAWPDQTITNTGATAGLDFTQAFLLMGA